MWTFTYTDNTVIDISRVNFQLPNFHNLLTCIFYFLTHFCLIFLRLLVFKMGKTKSPNKEVKPIIIYLYIHNNWIKTSLDYLNYIIESYWLNIY